MRFTKSSRAAAVITALALTVAACGAEEAVEETPAAPATTEGTTEEPAAAEPILLGYLLPETGQLAQFGPPMISAVQMAVAEINAAGGVLGSQIELISADEAGDAGRAAEEGNRLLAAGVTGIIGAASSDMTKAVIDAITSAGVVQCSPSNTGIDLTTYPDKGYYFRTAPSDVIQAPVLAEAILEANPTSVAVVARADDYGRQFLDETVKNLDARGATVALDETYDPASASFDSVVEAMLNSGADAFAVLSFDEGAQIVAGLLAAGISPTLIFGGDGIANANFDDLVPGGAAAIEGMTVTAQSAKFTEAFEARLRAFDPSLEGLVYASNAFDCVTLMALAAVQGGSADSATIRDNMISASNGENECSTYAECLPFLDAGESIAYQSSSGGALSLIEVREGGGEPSQGTIAVSRWTDGELVELRTVTGDLLG